MKNELNEALGELLHELRDLRKQALDTRDAMGKLATDSHLRSTLTLLREDVSFRKVLDLQS